MGEKVFCEKCGQRLFFGNLISNLIKKPMKVYEFKEGFYCEECSKKRVEEARNTKK